MPLPINASNTCGIIKVNDFNNNNFCDDLLTGNQLGQRNILSQGALLHKLADITNQENRQYKLSGFVPTISAKKAFWLAAATCFVGASVGCSAASINSNNGTLPLSVVNNLKVDIPDLAHSVAASAHDAYQSIGAISDALRFPMAYGAVIPDALQQIKHKKNRISGGIDSRAAGLAKKNQHVAKLLADISGDLSFVLNPKPREIITSFIRYLQTRSISLDETARAIQKVSGGYGAHKDEMLPSYLSKSIANSWVAENVFGSDIHFFLANALITHDPKSDVADRPIGSYLREAIINFLGKKSSRDIENTWAYLNHHVISLVLPLSSDVLADDVVSADREWAYKHAGASFALAAGVERGELSSIDAAALGRMVFLQAKTYGASSQLSRFFLVPALISQASLLKDEFHALSASNYLPLTNKALEFFFQNTGKGEAEFSYMDRFDNGLKTYQTWGKMVRSHPQYPASLLDLKFSQQNQHIADDFYQLDRLLVAAAMGRLQPEDFEFIAKADFTLATFNLVNQPTLVRPSGTTQDFQPDGDEVIHIPGPSDVDLVYVTQDNESRIYALQNAKGQYSFTRVDTDLDAYKTLLPRRDRARVQDDFTLNLSFQTDERSEWSTVSVPRVVDALAFKHKDIFMNIIKENSLSKTANDVVYDFLSNLMPYISCLTQPATHALEKINDCALDLLLMMPAVGQGAELSHRAVENAPHFGLSPSLSLKNSGKIMLEEQMAMLTLDPRINVMTTGLGKTAVTEILQMGNAMQDLIPGLRDALSNLNSRIMLDQLPLEFIPDKTITISDAFLPVEFIKPGGDRYQGRDIYLRLNGERTGFINAKYTLHDRRIHTIAPPEAARLSNPIDNFRPAS